MGLTLLNLDEARKAEAARGRSAMHVRRPLGRRMYASARLSRLTETWGQSNSSADAELASSLRMLRSRSRSLVRDAAHAKRAKRIVQNNVIGSGIGLQAQVMTARETFNERVNDSIEAAWLEWTRPSSCHTGGTLHFSDFERAAVGELFEAGEVFIRKHLRPFGDSSVPLALELIEPERIVDELQPSSPIPGAVVRMGVEVDNFHRPIAYWIRERHPGEFRLHTFQTDRIERVPADQIIHLYIVDRWPQTRGEPWLHAVARALYDMEGYSEAEITAARAAACYMGIIETAGEYGEDNELGNKEVALEPGIVERLAPGEKFNLASPNRPNAQADAFIRMMLRWIAAGADVSYESLSRDYSQSNYSSSRLALLDDRDLWRVLQLWFIRAFREPIHRLWLQQAVLARAIEAIPVEAYALNPSRFEAVRFKPRGWSWIDPTKEVNAYKEAVKAGLTTLTDVINRTADGRDFWDVISERARELKLAAELGLKFDTDPAPDAQPAADDPDASAAPRPATDSPDDPDDPDDAAAPPPGEDDEDRPGRAPFVH